PTGFMRNSFYLQRVLGIVPLVVSCTQPSVAQQTSTQSPAQQTDDLRKQLDQLKAQYQQTTRDLQQRIAGLEQQIQQQKQASDKAKEGTVSTVELAAQGAKKAALGDSNQVNGEYQGQIASEPQYDLLNEAETKISKL